MLLRCTAKCTLALVIGDMSITKETGALDDL